MRFDPPSVKAKGSCSIAPQLSGVKATRTMTWHRCASISLEPYLLSEPRHTQQEGAQWQLRVQVMEDPSLALDNWW